MSVQSYTFGTTKEGHEVTGFTLRNKNGLEVRCISYGCRLTHIILPDGTDVVRGFDNLAGYEADGSYQGAFVGRYANRIRGAAFELNGEGYRLMQNDGGNYLHGSWPNRVFEAEIIGENSVSFTYTSPDGEDGFPGECWAGVTYMLTDDDKLLLDYRATAGADTCINLTNHAYFNLAGQDSDSIEDTELLMNCPAFLEIDGELCPTGRVLETAGGAFDFTTPKAIGRDIRADDPQLKLGGGYDHCFIIGKQAGDKLALAATAKAAGHTMHVYTTQPAVQLYAGNMMDGTPGKGGRPLGPRSAFCLETQHYPDSPNNPDFPSTLLRKGGKYHQVTVLHFEW